MFEIKNVSKQYNREFALRNISLTIGKGMNFIVGASGSGKTTLLKIISGMEKEFDGEVLCCGQSVKTLSDTEKGYFYNHIFGFVWQDFHLLEERTVYENIMLPCYLNNASRACLKNRNAVFLPIRGPFLRQKSSLYASTTCGFLLEMDPFWPKIRHFLYFQTSPKQSAKKIMRDMKIQDLADKKVRLLSGGQKQRIAIARELMKNPQVIIADEPTSALDEKSAKTIMEILRTLSKSKTVIVVTHDTSLAGEKDRIIELDKGELVSTEEIAERKKAFMPKIALPYRLPFAKAWQNTLIGAKRKSGCFVTAVFSLLIAGVLLLTTASSAIGDSGNAEFKKLLDTYGENILDISVIGSFMSANGTDGNGEKSPNADVTQDISGLYEKYSNDDRVKFAVFLQPFEQISITLAGKKYDVPSSGSSPVLTKLLSGQLPNGNENEVVVPEAFVKQVGRTNESILGETITFECSVVNWDSGKPVYKPAKISAVIVGVSNNAISAEYEGQIYNYSIDDSFFFGKSALDEIRSQSEFQNESVNFLLRAKTPADLIAIKDELSAKGIVPLGQFELVEDMVRLQTQTTELSSGATAVISVLSLIVVIAISLTTSLLRKKEYAIDKISGYKTAYLLLLNLCDTILYALAAILLLFVTSPLLNLLTQNLLNFRLLQVDMLFSGAGIVLLLAVLYFVVSSLLYFKIDLSRELKSGEK